MKERSVERGKGAHGGAIERKKKRGGKEKRNEKHSVRNMCDDSRMRGLLPDGLLFGPRREEEKQGEVEGKKINEKIIPPISGIGSVKRARSRKFTSVEIRENVLAGKKEKAQKRSRRTRKVKGRSRRYSGDLDRGPTKSRAKSGGD